MKIHSKSRCEEKRGRGDEGPGSWSMKEKIVSVMVMVARVKSGVVSEETLSRDVSNFMFKIILSISHSSSHRSNSFIKKILFVEISYNFSLFK